MNYSTFLSILLTELSLEDRLEDEWNPLNSPPPDGYPSLLPREGLGLFEIVSLLRSA
jgi:hypothetical protein